MRTSPFSFTDGRMRDGGGRNDNLKKGGKKMRRDDGALPRMNTSEVISEPGVHASKGSITSEKAESIH